MQDLAFLKASRAPAQQNTASTSQLTPGVPLGGLLRAPPLSPGSPSVLWALGFEPKGGVCSYPALPAGLIFQIAFWGSFLGGVSGAGRELEGVSKAPCIPSLTPGASPQVQPWGQVTQRMSLRMGHPGLRTPVMGHPRDGSPQALLTLGHHRTSLPQVTLWDRSPIGPGDPPPAGGKAGTWDTGCNPCQRPWGPTLGVPTGILGCSAVLTPSSSPSSKQSEEAGPGGGFDVR